MKTKSIQIILVFLFVLAVCEFSFADGFYVPEVRQKLPDIPVQRALIKYRDGTETLIIESTLNGSGKNFGWVIPVPGEPFRFEKFSPGLLKTLSIQIGPKINHFRPDRGIFGLPIMVFLAIWMAIGCFSVVLWGKKGFFSFLLLLFVLFFGIPLLITYKAAPGSTSLVDSLLEIKHREIVGNYEIFVLEVEDGLEFDQWLQDNRLRSFPERAIPIIDHYIADGWYFVVARLQTTGDGISTPHPVLLEFETDSPVYPMQLTALPDKSVHLELFVIAEEEAIPINYDLRQVYCDSFEYNKFYIRNLSASDKAFVPATLYKYGEGIAHADALKVMWSGCVVTKFAGKISSSKMRDDMFFEFETPSPYQMQLYTAKGRMNRSIDNAALVIIFGLPLLTLRYRLAKTRKYKFTLKKLLLIVVALCAAGFFLTYAFIGKTIEVNTLHMSWPQNFMADLADVLSEPENSFETGEEFAKILDKEGIKNPITKEPILLEDSPGNIILERDEDGFLIKICLENGLFYSW
jgi:hypothetical protein